MCGRVEPSQGDVLTFALVIDALKAGARASHGKSICVGGILFQLLREAKIYPGSWWWEATDGKSVGVSKSAILSSFSSK
jgi:hypothetical protein